MNRVRELAWLVAASGVMFGWAASASGAARAHVDQGWLEGRLEQGLAVYRGVPFAAPPVGPLRWRPPEPPPHWQGVRAATAAAPSCMQTPQLESGLSSLELSEDCLYLNIWAPPAEPGRPLPVMVWIHGGGFIEGSPNLPEYDGANLARHGAIVVTVAYRLGPLGFLALPALSKESPRHVSGNYGLLDQIAALGWIRRNIAAFGGDPSRVTIFGQSAGGISTSILAASPVARGLFAGVISESGGSFGPVRVPPYPGENMQTLSDAERTGTAFVRKLHGETLAALRALSAQQVQSAGFALGDFWPAQDGWVIPGDQYVRYEHGEFNRTPVLLGSNSDEGALFPPQGTAEQFIAQVHQRFGPFAAQILELYPATGADWRQSAMDLNRDAGFAWPSLAWAELQERDRGPNVYLYYYAHVPPRSAQSRYKDATGAVHGEEVLYVFGNLGQERLPWSQTDHALSEQLMRYWTDFAKRGDPNGDGLARWPAFGSGSDAVMRFDSTAHAGSLPNARKLQLLDRYYAWRRTAAGATFARRTHE
jgi:para-nitrobenzyl esterase